MATYKKPCMQCGNLIDGTLNFCPSCGSLSPFGYVCPTCRMPITKNSAFCPGCRRQLYIACPHCGQRTFVQERCEACNQSLMVVCENSRCGALQFFENTKCTSCGKKIKARYR